MMPSMSSPAESDATPMEPLRIGVLGSGTGSNFRALVDRLNKGDIAARIVCVGSDVAESGILESARAEGIPTIDIAPGPYKATLEPATEANLVQSLREHGVELVVLAGFMRILKHDTLSAFAGRIINIHPSLLPKYRGMHAWKQAFLSGDTVTGCTVHYVDSGVDTGAIIAQAEVDIEMSDTPETLHARVQKAEHRLLPLVIEEISRRRSEFLP
jgi:phosphoribosylglycinamide formyltransferase-1